MQNKTQQMTLTHTFWNKSRYDLLGSTSPKAQSETLKHVHKNGLPHQNHGELAFTDEKHST